MVAAWLMAAMAMVAVCVAVAAGQRHLGKLRQWQGHLCAGELLHGPLRARQQLVSVVSKLTSNW